ncbi:MAG: YqgE/AlgH family protein [Chitinophagaceae bacterium]|nr:YqgE/AlgH family protein [Oligoflexus sp.]
MVQLSIPSLLVALPSMTDPHFSRSVILLVHHARDGAAGYVINRPLPSSLRDSSFQNRYQIPTHIPVWMGGPLSTNNGVVLHNEGRDVSATYSFGSVRISVSEEAIDGLIDSAEAGVQSEHIRRGHQPYRFILGQASWASKQLEAELKAGMWIQKPMDEKLVFATPWQEIWPEAFADLGIHPLDIKPSVQSYLN